MANNNKIIIIIKIINIGPENEEPYNLHKHRSSCSELLQSFEIVFFSACINFIRLPKTCSYYLQGERITLKCFFRGRNDVIIESNKVLII